MRRRKRKALMDHDASAPALKRRKIHNNAQNNKENIPYAVGSAVCQSVAKGREYERNGKYQQALFEYEIAHRLHPKHERLLARITRLRKISQLTLRTMTPEKQPRIRSTNRRVKKKERMAHARNKLNGIKAQNTMKRDDLIAVRTSLQNTKGRSRSEEELAIIIQSIGISSTEKQLFWTCEIQIVLY
eukprot:885186_1